MHVIVLFCINTYAKFEVPSFTNYKDMIRAKFKKRVTWLITPLLGVVCHHRLGFDTVYLHAKFDNSSFSRSGDMVGAHRNLNNRPTRDLTTPLSVIVCHLWASTCYDQPIYQIWSLYLYSLRRYKKRYKNGKVFGFPNCPNNLIFIFVYSGTDRPLTLICMK